MNVQFCFWHLLKGPFFLHGADASKFRWWMVVSRPNVFALWGSVSPLDASSGHK